MQVGQLLGLGLGRLVLPQLGWLGLGLLLLPLLLLLLLLVPVLLL